MDLIFHSLLALQQAPSSALFSPMLLMAVIFAIFYFVVLAPARKKQKALLDNLKKGDQILTTGGLYGEIAGIQGNVVILKIADNVKVRIARSAVSGVEGETGKGAGNES
jgi:preprotein translocase subunit YajC